MKRFVVMKVKNYLDFLTDPKILKILRVFVMMPGEYTGRHVSFLAKLNHKTTIKYLDHLSERSILGKKLAGRAYIYRLRENYFTQEVIMPLIKQEQGLYEKIKQEIINKLGTFSEAIVIYGSYARNRENEQSDLDVCFVVKEKTESFDQALDEYVSQAGQLYSLPVSPHVFTLEELPEKKDVEVVREIMDNGDWIFGDKWEVRKIWQS
ncbi:MAG: nucleotidyltransferase domain-containing protein [Dehalococcoidales bacterium]|nr:nucleotidyltransferase domain-containing protein [Dehalococcoidales bacterium]